MFRTENADNFLPNTYIPRPIWVEVFVIILRREYEHSLAKLRGQKKSISFFLSLL